MFKLHQGAEFHSHYLAGGQLHMVHRGAVKSQRKLNITGGLPVLWIQLISFSSLIEISSWFDVLWGIRVPITAGRDHRKVSVTTGAEDHDFQPHFLSSQGFLALFSAWLDVIVR